MTTLPDTTAIPSDSSVAATAKNPAGVSLRSLIAAYDHVVALAASVPTAFALAKLFTEMSETRGGLVLIGVDREGNVLGIDPARVDETYRRFENLCTELTHTRVEMGTLRFGSDTVIFLIFNTLPRNLAPMSPYRQIMDRHCWA